jgi:hypothetical protein
MISCARATRGLRRPSLDARSGGLIRVIPGNVHEQAWKDHLWSLAAALLDGLFDQPAGSAGASSASAHSFESAQ